MVLICASALVSVESLMTHRREREAQIRIVSLHKVLAQFEPFQQAMFRDKRVMLAIARKHGLEPEMQTAMLEAEQDERDLKAKAAEVASPAK
jgi:hypothetical protein